MAILKSILIILEVLLLFNLIIGVHELGHFLAARWRGLRVDRFAIWFGKPIWKRTIGGIEYALGWAPFGGYVALPQMATMEAIEGKGESSGQSLPPVSALDKIIVALAGPLFSFGLALAFAVVVWGVGKPVSQSDKTTTIGWVEPEGPAWKAGLRPGDRIVEIDGKAVSQFPPPSQDSITWRIVTSEGTNIALKYIRNGQESMAYAVPYHRPTKVFKPFGLLSIPIERKSLRQILIAPATEPVIAGVASNSPAALAGLRPGDKIVAINGERIFSILAVLHAEDALTNGAANGASLTIERGTERFERVVASEKPLNPPGKGPSLGITEWLANTNVLVSHPSPASQIRESAGQIFGTIGALFSRKSDVGVQQLGGAVMIIRVYSNLFGSEHGWRQVIWFSVVLNVNLAMLNLVPLPVLDGGHILLALLELLRRRPVSGRILQYIQNGFAALLITFMVYIAFFDTSDWLRSARKDRQDDQPIVFAPKK